MKFGIGILSTIGAVLLTAIVYNAAVTVPVFQQLRSDPSVELIVYREHLISPRSIVVDVRGVRGSMFDVDFALRRAADALRGRKFDRIVLANDGQPRFILDGAYFLDLGESPHGKWRIWEITNHVTTLEGAAVFEPVSDDGGDDARVDGLERHNTLHERWWAGPR